MNGCTLLTTGQDVSVQSVRSVSQSVSQLVSWLVGHLVSWSAGFSWLFGQLISYSAGQLVNQSVSLVSMDSMADISAVGLDRCLYLFKNLLLLLLSYCQ